MPQLRVLRDLAIVGVFVSPNALRGATTRAVRARRRTTCLLQRAPPGDRRLDEIGHGGAIAAARVPRRRYGVVLEVAMCSREVSSVGRAGGRLVPSEQNSDGSQADRLPTFFCHPNCPEIADLNPNFSNKMLPPQHM